MNPWRGLGVLPREVWFLCLAILVNRAGTMVLPFLTLYLTIDRRLSVSTAGLTLTVYGIGAILVAPLAGRLSDRLGGLRIMKLSLLLSGLLLFVFPFANHLTSILAITAVWAIANEAFRPPSMSLIGDLAGPAQRKAAFALCRLAINLGMSIGPVIGGFLAMRSFKLLFYFDGATTLLAALLLAVLPWRIKMKADGPGANQSEGVGLRTGESVSDTASPLRYSSVLKNRRFIYFVIAMIPVELVFFQPMAAMPLFLVRDLHFTEAGYGMLSAVNTVIIILVEVAVEHGDVELVPPARIGAGSVSCWLRVWCAGVCRRRFRRGGNRGDMDIRRDDSPPGQCGLRFGYCPARAVGRLHGRLHDGL